MKTSKAFDKIFGGVNTGATSRSADPRTKEHPVMRKGKTARDKAAREKSKKENK